MNTTSREKLIHCGWTIGVLTFFVICLLTGQIDEDAELITQIGIATGLVSLVVGIIAIVYAFTTNGALNDSTSRLEKSSKAIEEAAQQTISSIDGIRSNLAPLAKQISEIHSNFPLPSQASQSTASPTPASTGQIDANQFIDHFLGTSSWFGLITLYAAIKRSQANKPFNAYTWTAAVGGLSPDYAIGYFICTASTGMITYDHSRFLQEGNLFIRFVSTGLREKIDRIITTNLQRQGLSQEDINLRARQKEQTDAYISQS